MIASNPKTKLEDSKSPCPRCYSDTIRGDNVQTNSDMIDRSAGYNVDESTVEHLVGNVCGYWLNDLAGERKEPFWKSIFGIFKR
ncbi:MAG: hypothetical protein CL843_06930 [Crocinitomicaceae bacterium]|nr:hypothetical protein [Crocinitomicaceae bacterium]